MLATAGDIDRSTTKLNRGQIARPFIIANILRMAITEAPPTAKTPTTDSAIRQPSTTMGVTCADLYSGRPKLDGRDIPGALIVADVLGMPLP